MGNRTWSLLFLFLIAGFVSVESWGQMAQMKIRKNFEVQCPSDMSGFTFVGQKFNVSRYTCVRALSDNEARQRCSGELGLNYLDPSSADYGGDPDGSGFYYCYQGPRKSELCKAAGGIWSPVGNAIHKDGTCKCNGEDCTGPNAPASKAATTASKTCTGLGLILDTNYNNKCVCDGLNGFTEKTPGDIDKDPVCESKNAPTARAAAPAAETGISQELVKCVDDALKDSKECKSSAESANKRCDLASKENPENEKAKEDAKKNENADLDELKKLPGDLSKVYVQANQGKGMSTQCFKAGIISNSSALALKPMKVDCDENIKKCNETCGPNKAYDLINKCIAIIQQKYGTFNRDEETPEDKYLSANQREIQINFAEGTPLCKVDAAKKASYFDDGMNMLANSLRAGMTCACQFAASVSGQSGAGCSSLPTAAQCAANPALPGCAAYSAVDLCTIGSASYSYQGCKCQMDPKAAGCAAFAAANPNNSGFAGPDIKIPTEASAGIGPVGVGSPSGVGGLGDDRLDLSGQKAEDASPVAKSNTAGPGFLGGAGGGGGGGAAGGSGGGGGGSAEAPAQGDGGGSPSSGGIFGQAKSFLSNLMNGKPSGNSTVVRPGGQGQIKINTDKFRPKGMRDLAGDSEFGSKNKDIWLMMNERYSANENTFILSP